MPKITVYTKTYNRMSILPRTIESVLSQSFTDFTYVIYDNGSVDDTRSVIDSYMKKDKRIRCISSKKNQLNGEPEEVFDIQGDNIWYVHIDDDDYVDRNMLKELYGLAMDTGSDIVTVGSCYVCPDGTMTNKYVYDGVYTVDRIGAMYELLKRDKINSAKGGKMYKKKLLQNIKCPNLPRICDIHWEYRVFDRIESTITMSGKPMYYFYRHDKNLSGLNTKEQILHYIVNILL